MHKSFPTDFLDIRNLKVPRPVAEFEDVSLSEAGDIVCSLFENKKFVELCIARVAGFIDDARFMSQFASQASSEHEHIKAMEAEERRMAGYGDDDGPEAA